MDPTRLTKNLQANITVQKSISEESTAAPQETKKIQQGTASIKDSFEVARPKVFSLDTEKGQINFGDGIHGKRPPTGEAAANGGAIDPNSLVQYVLRESYLQTTEDLRFFAEKVKYFNDIKNEVRDYFKGSGKAEVARGFDNLTLGQLDSLSDAITHAITTKNKDDDDD